MNVLHLDIELSPTESSGQLVRGIEVVADECRDVIFPPPFTACADTIFGGPHDLPDHASILLPVPPAIYQCVQVRDPLHTLPSACDVTCTTIPGEGQVWYGALDGAEGPDGSCHWLINGNLNGFEDDGRARIDILDYVAFIAAVIDAPSPSLDSPCGSESTHADINGDGSVDVTDFSFVVENLFRHDRSGCAWVCDDVGAGPTSIVLRDEITVSELAEMGLARAGQMADLNDDGLVNLTDLFLYADGDAAPNDDRVSGRFGKRFRRSSDSR
jgi:hypothetical protein